MRGTLLRPAAAQGTMLRPAAAQCFPKPLVEMVSVAADQFDLLNVPSNGWSFWLAISRQLDTSGKEKNISFGEMGTAAGHNIRETANGAAQGLAEDVADHVRRTNPPGVRDAIDAILKREGKAITVDDYLTALATPVNPGNLDEGPQAVPDPAVFLPIVSSVRNDVKLTLYQPSGGAEGMYTPTIHAGIDASPRDLHILYGGATDYAILIPKGPVVAAAASSPAPAPAAAADATPAPAAPAERRGGRAANAMTNARARALNAKEAPPPSASAEGEGKLRRAMRSAAGRLTAKSLKDAKARLGRAAKATRRLIVTGNYVGEVIIAGERVRLNEENFNPDKFYDVVSFHDKYFPRKEITDLVKEKETFGRVFGDGAPVAPGTAAPSLPCEPSDAEVLLEGLKTRFEGLRNETVLLYEQVGETVDVRARIDHIQRLKLFIDGLERAGRDGTCVDFQDLAAVTEKDVRTEEEIRALLRQFAFMILQARAPVPEYADRTRIVQDFIEELQRDPVSEEEMNAYLILWKEQAAARGIPDAMPTVLGEVLDTTSTQRGLLDMMLEDKLEALYLKIVEAVRVDYSVPGVPPALLEEFNRFILEEITTKGTTISPQERVVAVVKKTVSMNLKCWQELKEKEGLVESLQAEVNTVQGYLQKAEVKLEEYAAKEVAAAGEKEGFVKQLQDLTGENAAMKVELEAKEKAAGEAAEAAAKEIASLNTTIGTMHSDLAALDVQLRAAVKEREDLEAKAISALEAEEALQVLLERERTEHEDLKGRYTALKEERDALEVRAAAADKELLAAQAALKGAQAEIERLSTGASQSAQEAADNKGKIAELLTQITGLDANVAALKAEKEGLEGQLEACRAALDAEGQKFRALTEEKVAAGEEAAKRIGEAEGAAAEAAVKMRSAQAAVGLSAAQIKLQMDRIRDLQAEVVSARDQLRVANEAVARMQGEAAAGDVAASAKVEKAVKEVQEATERLEALQRACKEAEETATAALADRDGQIKKLQEDLTTAAAREAATAASLAEAQAALEKKNDEMNVAAAKAAEGLETANGEGAARAAKLGAELAQLRAAVEAGQKELAAVTAAKVECEEALGAAKASVVAAGRREAEAVGRADKFEHEVLRSLQGLAQNVLEGKMQGPEGVKPALGTAFQRLLENIRQANEKAMATGLASGAAANPYARFSPATQVCFMTHFITFFVKTLFFTQDMADMRYGLFQALDAYVGSAVEAYKAAHEGEGDEKHILFKMLTAAFSLLHAGETLYINKQTVTGLPAMNYIGLQVIKQNTASGTPDTERGDIVRLMWEAWAAVPSQRDVKLNIGKAVETVFGQILLLKPTVHFNPPIKPQEGVTTDVLKLLHAYPSLTFLPTEGRADTKIHDVFTEVDVDNGFAMKKHNILAEIPKGVAGAKAAEIAWPGAVRAVMQNDTLSFADLFCIFVMLGRRYLISIRDDLIGFKCPLPAFLADPEGARGALKGDKAAADDIKKGADAAAAALKAKEEAAAAAAAALKAKEEAEAAAALKAKEEAAEETRRQQRARWDMEAKRKLEEEAAAAAAQKRAAEEAAAAAAPPAPFGQNLSRPKTAGGAIKPNIETFMAIFNRVNTGSTNTPTDILSDIKVNGDKKVDNEDAYPILSFIKTYGTFTMFFRAISFKLVGGDPPEKQIQTAMQTLVAALNDRLKARQVVPATTPGQSTGGSVNFLRKFLLRFIDSYIYQYKVEGQTTTSGKFATVYPEFKQCFNINIQVLNPNNPPKPKEITHTLFDELQITDAMVKSLVEHDGAFDRKYKDIAKDIVVHHTNENRIRFIGGQPAK